MKKVDIGLDIGIASVGWAITDVKTLEIEEYGARLFPTVDDSMDSKLKNEKRREARSTRRQVNRRRTLKRDFVKFLINQKYIDDVKFGQKEDFVNEFRDKYINNAQLQRKWKQEAQTIPYILKIRNEACHHKVAKNKLIAILYWYINHRGFKYEQVEEKEKPKAKTKSIVDFKDKDEQKLPVENQIQYFQDKKYLNGTFNRTFHQKEYLKEIRRIFAKQNLDEKFTQGFIKLFSRQRSFEEGPGNEKSKTKYGRFYNLQKTYGAKNQFSYELKKVDKVPSSIWESTIGRCTFYPQESRAPRESFTANVYNLLNELNNIHNQKTGEVLDQAQKIRIIKMAINNGTSGKMVKEVYKFFELDPKDDQATNEIKGFPVDKSQKRFLSTISSLTSLRKILPQEFITVEYLFDDLKINENNIIDKIITIFSKTKTIDKRMEELEKAISGVIKNKKIISHLAEANIKGVAQTHSLSFKAMQAMIPNLIREPRMNQMVWAQQNGIDFNKDKNYGTKYLNSEWITDVITTPSVKRSIRQTTKVLNAIFKLANDKNWKIRAIVIEMARETKNQDAKDQETNRQKYFEKKNQEIRGIIEGSTKTSIKNLSNRTLEKIWLLDQQKRHDAYTGEKIDMEEVIKNPGHFDIDHIIPYSQSYSNNRSNKVLTRQQNNSKKSNLTSFQYLSKLGTLHHMQKLWKDWYLSKERKVYKDYDKYNFLTTNIDFSKPQNQLGFIQRNLVDTRYTTKAVMTALQVFSKNDQNNFNFKVKAINGRMTSFARHKIAVKYENGRETEWLKRPYNLPLFEEKEVKSGEGTRKIKFKSRIWNGHHAEDAYIVTILNSHYNDSKAIEKILSSPHLKFSQLEQHDKEQHDKWIAEKFSDLMAKLDIAREKLNTRMPHIRFSRMIEKNRNTQLFNESLYKGRMNTEGLVDKYGYKEILSKDFKAGEYFGKAPKHKTKLMIYKHDKDLYSELNKIYLNYFVDHKTNPFLEATQDEAKKYIEITYKVKNRNITKKIKRLNLLSQEGKTAKDPLKIIQAHNNGNSFYESMEWVAINMYKDKNERYRIIPINASNHTFKTLENDKVQWIVKHDILKKQLEAKDIENNKPIATFFKGDVLILPNDEGLAYICGQDESGERLELKFLFRQKIDGDKRGNRTINTKLIGSKLIKSDILGIRYKKKFIF